MVAPSESCYDLQGSLQPDFSQKTGQFDMKSYQILFFDGVQNAVCFLAKHAIISLGKFHKSLSFLAYEVLHVQLHRDRRCLKTTRAERRCKVYAKIKAAVLVDLGWQRKEQVSIRILPVWGDYKRSEGPWVHTRSKAGLRKRIARRSCGSLAASGGLRAHSARSPERTCPVLASEKAGLPQGTASPGGERRVEQGWGRRSAGVALPAARLAAAASRAGAGWVMDGLPARVRAAGRAEDIHPFYEVCKDIESKSLKSLGYLNCSSYLDTG
ncbi:hypothetical protein MJG53_012586 [Ovis ammon polii x Ovis aries]|uniref:Uncharacterized protein n=1 Tax=Ovis ammon polii x Ovis aries TaxID=2918886 RepID=A0ACB9ULB4_9CETA|nr:hypothetical protein MJG53_012586 [Ovis ammon polii x Ovis aries]